MPHCFGAVVRLRVPDRAIHTALVAGLVEGGVPAEVVQLMPTQDRAAVGAMLAASGLIDMIVPRGGKSLVARVQADARVPVLAHLDGINHTYIDRQAEPAMASDIALNAKMRQDRDLRFNGNPSGRCPVF
jgi:glutamate-5-semialdehyde dehydrogenase